ncbi:MAG: DUF2948 family protein [Rhizobiaceae bacterium]
MKPLRLAALDEEDLKIVSAHMQDAVLKVGDIDYRPGDGRLLLPVNRFAWEIPQRLFRRHNERRNAVLQFDRVVAMRSSGLDRGKKDAILAVLAIRFEETEAPSGRVEIVFSGDAAIRLDVECIEARLTDLGAAWQAASRPAHPR